MTNFVVWGLLLWAAVGWGIWYLIRRQEPQLRIGFSFLLVCLVMWPFALLWGFIETIVKRIRKSRKGVPM